MVIQTAHLILRPFKMSDLDTTHKYASNPENTEFMIHLPNKTKQETEQFLQRVINEWKKDSPYFY